MVLDSTSIEHMKNRVVERTSTDQRMLDAIRQEIRELIPEVKIVRPYHAPAVSLVASDGGNDSLIFDPFNFHLVRVTDSYGMELCLDVVTPTTDPDLISNAQFDSKGSPISALGRLMADLNVALLSDLSYMIPDGESVRNSPDDIKPGWVQTYRDLWEWATLYDRIVHQSFATDTLLVRDGLLRSKIFSKDLFIKMFQRIDSSIEEIQHKEKRKIYLAGLAKHSKVIDRYRLAMTIEELFPPGDPYYVNIPPVMELKAYMHQEAYGGDFLSSNRYHKNVAGDMYMVRFGKERGDPVWAVDILTSQTDKAKEVMGHLLNDALNGFPVPFYPRCLQLAHEHAQISQMDMKIFQDQINEAVRNLVPKERQDRMDEWSLYKDVSMRRYK